MKKIISTLFWMVILIIAGLCIYKAVTNKSAVEKAWGKYEKVIDLNRMAPQGTTLECPICEKEFVKGRNGSPFCSKNCERKYKRIVKHIKTEGDIEDGILNVYDSAKEKIKEIIEDNRREDADTLDNSNSTVAV